MSGNSSFSNESVPYQHDSSNHIDLDKDCLLSPPSSLIYNAYNIITILLLLPICILVLQHGLYEWWKKHSTSTAATVSHSDSFTYHVVIMELIGISGCVLSCCGTYIVYGNVNKLLGHILLSFTWYGETFFHVLTCVEHYMAVVHPIIYLSLRKESVNKLRNINNGCIWLLTFALTCLLIMYIVILDFCLLIFVLIVVTFCSLSVLCVLIRPGPGGQAGNRERADQSKQRAFYTILAILGALVLKFVSALVWSVVFVLARSNDCLIMAWSHWLNLPSSLVLPLLFLHRAGKLVHVKNIIMIQNTR